MFTPIKMRLNVFKSVRIPSSRALFERFGYSLERSSDGSSDPSDFSEHLNSEETPTGKLREASSLAESLRPSEPSEVEPQEPSASETEAKAE